MIKKYFLLLFCLPLSAYSTSKDGLERAIRSLNVRSVEQIVTNVSFTQKEYNCYVALAEEVVRNREIWLWRPDHHSDITTPSEMPSRLRIRLDVWGALLGTPVAALCYAVILEGRERDMFPFFTGAIVGTALVARLIHDVCLCFYADEKQRERIRQKYEDALSIRQLIYAVDVIEA